MFREPLLEPQRQERQEKQLMRVVDEGVFVHDEGVDKFMLEGMLKISVTAVVGKNDAAFEILGESADPLGQNPRDGVRFLK